MRKLLLIPFLVLLAVAVAGGNRKSGTRTHGGADTLKNPDSVLRIPVPDSVPVGDVGEAV